MADYPEFVEVDRNFNLTAQVEQELVAHQSAILAADELIEANTTAIAGHETRLDAAEPTIIDHETRLDTAEAELLLITSGVYTPTLTNVTNLAASAAFQCQYMRVGTVVTVSGKVTVDPTLSLLDTELGISLPIASNFAQEEDCGGAGHSPGVSGMGVAIMADSANNRAAMKWTANDLANQTVMFSFTYRII